MGGFGVWDRRSCCLEVLEQTLAQAGEEVVEEAPACCRMCICCLASSGVHVSLSRIRGIKPTECYQSSMSKERGESARVVV